MKRNLASQSILCCLPLLALVACEHADPNAGLGSTPSETTTTPTSTGPSPTGPMETPLPTSTGEPGEPYTRKSCADAAYAIPINLAFSPGYLEDESVVTEAQNILRSLSLDQKVIQLTGVPDPGSRQSGAFEDIQRSRDDEIANLRGYQWRDGPHGLNLEAGRGRRSLENFATSFPVSVSQGASFDLDVVYRMGMAMGDETVAAKNNVLLGPCMNILRHPYWGRAQETFGEDVFHLGRIATAYTAGLQEFITGCAKHYAGNNIEVGRNRINAEMDEQTLREIYGRHFEMVVQDGGVGCIMAAYNRVNGIKATQSKHLLTTMLRDDMGFKGFVLTDWWAMPGEQSQVAPPQDGINTKEALEAGLDVEVPWLLNYDSIPALINSGELEPSVLDTAVLRVLKQKLRFKSAYLDQPQMSLKAPTTVESAAGSITNNDHHVELAREGAEKGMVLLKNEDAAGAPVLPIPATATTIAVLGATMNYRVPTDNPPDKVFNWVTDIGLGDRGSSRVRPNPAQTVGALAGITAEAPPGVNVVSGANAQIAADANFIVVLVGLTAGDEGEEYTGAGDRESLSLGAIQNDLVRQAAALGKPMVVVIQAGGVVDMPWLESVPAVVMAWYPGQQGGAALGRLLFGKTNFAGRLPVTWPTNVNQFPVFDEGETTRMDYFLGYRRFDKEGLTPLYAFGHGLSYSTFEYSKIEIPCSDITDTGTIDVVVELTNTSAIPGDEVIQVYASFPETAVRRSIKELKGFQRVHLPAGEGRRVTIPIRVQDLKYWDMTQNAWVVEKGPVLLQVGPSSDKLILSETIIVK